jgi:hypothetical protein
VKTRHKIAIFFLTVVISWNGGVVSYFKITLCSYIFLKKTKSGYVVTQSRFEPGTAVQFATAIVSVTTPLFCLSLALQILLITTDWSSRPSLSSLSARSITDWCTRRSCLRDRNSWVSLGRVATLKMNG